MVYGLNTQICHAIQNKNILKHNFKECLFTIDKSIRYRERMALGLTQDSPVILLPARFDPVKNHTDFIMMAKILLSMRSDVFFIMIGEGINNKNIYNIL